MIVSAEKLELSTKLNAVKAESDKIPQGLAVSRGARDRLRTRCRSLSVHSLRL